MLTHLATRLLAAGLALIAGAAWKTGQNPTTPRHQTAAQAAERPYRLVSTTTRGDDNDLDNFGALVTNTKYRTLVALLAAADLDGAVRDAKQLTIFAPSDEAFGKLAAEFPTLLQPKNRDTLRGVLTYHVVPRALDPDHIVGSQKTLAGTPVMVARNGRGLAVNDAVVTNVNRVSDTLIVYEIDRILTPLAPDIVETAKRQKFNTLVTALLAANLAEALQADGPFTVFAPTDKAFEQLGSETVQKLLDQPDELAKILKLHVVAGKVTPRQLAARSELDTIGNQPIAVVDDGHTLRVGGAEISDEPIVARNGLIYKASAVLQAKPAPKDIATKLANGSGFHTILKAVEAAGLVEALKADGPITLFAPGDEAFERLGDDTLKKLLKPENKAALAEILKYHVVAGKVTARDAVQAGEAKTLQGQKVTARIASGRLLINDARVTLSDVEASNGVIHAIDRVLLPEDK